MNTRTIGLTAVLIGALVALAVLPAFLAPATSSTAGACGPLIGGPVDVIAATIRHLESGDDYTARAPGSTASGAYQFLDSSWAGYGGYPRAWLAPPQVQDAKAAELIASVLAANGDDVSAVPVSWYIGHVPPPGSPEWDTVPSPGAGNRLTPREYQAKWMDVYRAKLTGAPGVGDDEHPSCPAGTGELVADGWALPGPREVLDATADQIDNPHHDYPAWDWAIPAGTPIYAIRGGTVVAITNNPYNCYRQAGCEACGLGVTINDDLGSSWTYCHGSAIHVAIGDPIAAGRQLLSSGNSGNSSGPHLHLGLKVDAVSRCPQPLIRSLYTSGLAMEPSALATSGCTF